MADETETISLQDARQLVQGALTANGVPRDCAGSVARALVAAEAEGQIGHGFSRLADYVAQVRSGKVDAAARPVLQEKGPASAVVDACHGFAYPALDMAIAWGLQAAGSQGCAVMAVTRSSHCGALSLQVEKIARGGAIGLMVANAPAAIAPWGSNVPLFGTNPIAFSAPRQDGPPLVIDLSLSRVARGKVMHAKKSGTQIPLGWALDKAGRPTTDPAAALEGSMIAIGEAKGAALALMVETLSAVFTGANTSAEVSSFFSADGPPSGAGQFLMAIRPLDADGFSRRLDAVLGAIATLEGARVPGSRRAAAIEVARASGIAVPRHYLRIARDLCGARR